MGVLIDALNSVDFLHGESADVVCEFLAGGKCADREAGETFWRAGTPPLGIVIPVTGEAKTVSHGADGREFIDRLVGPGECLGLQGTLDGIAHGTAAEVSRAGVFFDLSRPATLELFDRHPAVRTKAVEALGRIYRRSVSDREDVIMRPVQVRFARFLIEHACIRRADGARMLLHATQSEIAARLGTVREVVSRVLSDFISRGLLARTDAGLFIDDWAGLNAIAGIEPGPHGTEDPVSRAAAKVRTARFYLPRSEDWTKARENERLGCLDHTGNLGPCERADCPGAREEAAAIRNPAGAAAGPSGAAAAVPAAVGPKGQTTKAVATKAVAAGSAAARHGASNAVHVARSASLPPSPKRMRGGRPA